MVECMCVWGGFCLVFVFWGLFIFIFFTKWEILLDIFMAYKKMMFWNGEIATSLICFQHYRSPFISSVDFDESDLI